MKAVIVADLHFRGKNLGDKKKAWELAIDKMIERKVDKVILAGDIFDTRNIGGREASMGTVFRAFMDPLKRIISERVPVNQIFILQGNHELSTGEQLSALEPLKELGIEIVDYFGLANVEGGFAIYFIPWVLDPAGTRDQELKVNLGAIKERFEDIGSDSYKIVVGHLTVRGAQLNSGISLMGTEFEVDPAQLEDLGADLIVLGHIHKRQQVGKNIHYVGALSQNNFGEEGNLQGFMIVDTEKRTHEFVEIDAPRYVTLNGKDKFPDVLPGDEDYVKYRFSEKPENYDDLVSNPKATIEIVPERETITRKVEGVEAGLSDEALLDAYLRIFPKGMGRNEVDRARIIKVARELAAKSLMEVIA